MNNFQIHNIFAHLIVWELKNFEYFVDKVIQEHKDIQLMPSIMLKLSDIEPNKGRKCYVHCPMAMTKVS